MDCPKCRKRLCVQNTRIRGETRVQYMACDTCKYYLKTVDLTRQGNAVPLVDEVAGGPLDLWARDHGYQKIELNLVGL